jgi:hypothetical protein
VEEEQKSKRGEKKMKKPQQLGHAVGMGRNGIWKTRDDADPKWR